MVNKIILLLHLNIHADAYATNVSCILFLFQIKIYIPVNAQIKSQILTSDKNKNKPQWHVSFEYCDVGQLIQWQWTYFNLGQTLKPFRLQNRKCFVVMVVRKLIHLLLGTENINSFFAITIMVIEYLFSRLVTQRASTVLLR